MDPSNFTETTLHQAETRFQRALLLNDVKVLDHILHEDVRFTGPDGSTINKSTDIAAHRAQTFGLTAVNEMAREAQVIDGVGITRTTLHLIGASGEQELDMILAYTRVWSPSENGWLIIAAHGGPGLQN
jgi:hypothetical protein